jgi:hypothetical protein
MKAQDIAKLEALPHATACRLIDFDTAEVVRGIMPNTYFLIVRGTKPWLTMDVELAPRIYIVQPDYWGIEVVGCQSGIGLPMEAPYAVVLNISHVRGTKGIEVIGATHSKQIDVP